MTDYIPKIDINTILNQKLMNRYQNPQNNNAGGMQGLLNFVQSPRGMDMATGLLAQSGYSPTPTNLGSAFGKANQYASAMQLKRDANELAELQALGSVAKSLKPKNKSDFFLQLDMFNEISSIPVDQRSEEQNRTLNVLSDKLQKDTNLNEYKVYLAEKFLKEGELTDDNDLALLNYLKSIDPISALIAERVKKKVSGGDDNKDSTITFDAQSEIKKMNDMSTEEAKEYFNNLPKDQQDAIRKIYNG